jgi:hypothetical protein
VSSEQLDQLAEAGAADDDIGGGKSQGQPLGGGRTKGSG